MVQSNQLSEFIWLKYDTDEQTLAGLKSWGHLFISQLRKKKELFMQQGPAHGHKRRQWRAVDEVGEGIVSWRCCLTWDPGETQAVWRPGDNISQGLFLSHLPQTTRQLASWGSGAAVPPRGHKEGQGNSDIAWETPLTGSQAEDSEVRPAAQEQTCSWGHETHRVHLSEMTGKTLMRERNQDQYGEL